MKKQSVLLLAMVVLLGGRSLAADYSGGNGSAENPYRITTAADMNEIGANPDDWDAHFVMVNDINLADYTGTEFNIIGNDTDPFTGVFDGNDFKISNFTYSSPPNESEVGIFGYVRGKNAEIKNVGIIEPNIAPGPWNNIGSLVGRLRDGVISGCYVDSGNISGVYSVGGLVGHNGGIITDCYSSAIVSGVASSFGMGGLVGSNAPHSRGVIKNCYSTGSVLGYGYVGGLVGENFGIVTSSYSTAYVSGEGYGIGGLVGRGGGTIIGCYSAGSVEGDHFVGGLAGSNGSGSIAECYSTGSVSGNQRVGGFVGYTSGPIADCYSTGGVSGTGYVGGFVGEVDTYRDPPITNCFWNIETGGPDNGIGMPLTTEQMQTESTFTSAGWDFVGERQNGPSEVWANPESPGPPILWWQLDTPPDLPSFASGSGTGDDPYLISDANQLNSIGHNHRLMDAHYELTSDVNLADVNFFSIGSEGVPFTGTFKGNNFKISNLTYSFTSENCVGLFGYARNPEIKDLGLTAPEVNAGLGNHVGSLIGYFYVDFGKEGIIYNCYVQGGNVSGNDYVGGLLGYNGSWYRGGDITSCYSIGTVSGNNYVGGFTGVNNGTIAACYSAGSVLGADYTGGLVGESGPDAKIAECYSTASVSGVHYVGGLIGSNGDTITTCYSTGSISGANNVGGLVGYNYNQGSIWNCYATGAVSGQDYVGGLLGENDEGTVTASFWDIETGGSDNGIGTPLTTEQMQTKSTFTDAGWDFVGENLNGTDDIWRLCVDGTDYPNLSWQFLLGDFICPDGVEMRDFAVLAAQWQLEKLSADVYPDGGDGFVNFLDWAVLSDGWQNTTDINDLAVFAEQWLQLGLGTCCADIAPPPDGDNVVNMLDLSALAENWLAGVSN